MRPVSDLSASCGLQGPGPRGRTGPRARSRRPHDRAPGERNRQGESWQEKTLRCPDHSVRRRFCTPPPCAQMFTSCQNPQNPCANFLPEPEPPCAQTVPIIKPPSSEGAGHLLVTLPLSLAGFGAQIALRLSHEPKRAASSLIGPGAW